MNKKGCKSLIGFLIVIIVLSFFIFLSYSLILEYKRMKEYRIFCNERPTFCYCDLISCEFKTNWNSAEGLSNDTIALCKLAKELNNKKMMFKAGCDNATI